MKPLFLLGRLRRSAITLETELQEFEETLGLSDDAVTCGDLAFWPLVARREEAWGPRYHGPESFWKAYSGPIGSGLISEYVIGELGRHLLSASQTEHVDEYDGKLFGYGSDEEERQGAEIPASKCAEDDEDDDWDEWDYSYSKPHPYDDRLFHTAGAGQWFEGIRTSEETPSFGRKS